MQVCVAEDFFIDRTHTHNTQHPHTPNQLLNFMPKPSGTRTSELITENRYKNIKNRIPNLEKRQVDNLCVTRESRGGHMSKRGEDTSELLILIRKTVP